MDFNTLINSGCLNPTIYEEMYALYQKNPSALDVSWKQLFDQIEKGIPQKINQIPNKTANTSDESQIHKLIDAYRTYGHLVAHVNPIATKALKDPIELNLQRLDFTPEDLKRQFPTCELLKEPNAPLEQIIEALKAIYSNKIGIEYMGLQNFEMEKWIQEQIEPTQFKRDLSIKQKKLILEYLNKSEIFESFLHTKFVGQKRFSLEGAETLIPMLAAIIEEGAITGIDEFTIGMAHRGRLNVLSNIFNKPYADIFVEFEEGYFPVAIEGSGDVKYHKGFYSEKQTLQGLPIKLTLMPNPSHLEAVGAVIEGQTRARQVMRDDKKQEKVLPILVHGDGALSGQGIVYEILQFCRLEGYSTGGTIHFIINNQVAFTTVPKDSRSTYYCTDIAHAFGAPVFHVDAESPEECLHATNLAVALRQKFHCDVFIELNCYRKYGHNEGDEPFFTQPIEYKMIRAKSPIREIYRDVLVHEGVLEKQIAESLELEFKASLESHLKQKAPSTQTIKEQEETPLSENGAISFQKIDTAVSETILKTVGERICFIPSDLTVHPKLVALLKERSTMLQSEKPIDWGMAELLAYGTLLWENKDIRLSGQDCCRGTFSHRHAMLMDQVKELGYIPLQHLKPDQGRFDVYNSPLSEYAVLGFEFGYSVTNLNALVIWEAQFGDFSNGAQIIIDQFIAASEQKWGQKSALTLFLPHGYEGQGPEHSSARIERFLTLAGDYNMQIVNPTNPAQLFHLLRRQSLRELKKPLIVFTPKGLLRHPKCINELVDLTKGTFQEVIDDPLKVKAAKRLVLCSGRIYYDLIAEREKMNCNDLSIVRIEQLYPLHVERLKEIINNYSEINECLWVQEEPSNMGAWNFLRATLRELLPDAVVLKYVGRNRSASTAVGSHAVHKKQHAAILNAIFKGVK